MQLLENTQANTRRGKGLTAREQLQRGTAFTGHTRAARAGRQAILPRFCPLQCLPRCEFLPLQRLVPAEQLFLPRVRPRQGAGRSRNPPVPLLLKLRPAVSAFHDGVGDPTLLRREERRYSPSPEPRNPQADLSRRSAAGTPPGAARGASRRAGGCLSAPGPTPPSSSSGSQGCASPGPSEGGPSR